MNVTFLDTETTGLPRPLGADLVYQPYITEIYMETLDKKFKTVDVLHTLVRPPVPIPELITKITGITDETLKGAPPFKKVFKKLNEHLKKSDRLVAHNLAFDKSMLDIEASRLNKSIKYPPSLFCTVEQSMHMCGYRLKLKEIFELATGLTEYGAHRADADVKAMIEVYKYILEGNKCGSI